MDIANAWSNYVFFSLLSIQNNPAILKAIMKA